MNIFLLLGIEILFFFLAFIVSNQDIMAPSVMMCVMFIVSTMAAILNINNWSIDYNMLTVFVLATGIGSFILTEMVIRSVCLRKKLKTGFREGSFSHIKDISIEPWLLIVMLLFNLLVINRYYTEVRRIVGAYGRNPSNVVWSYRVIVTSLALRSDASVEMTSTLLNQCIKVVSAVGYVTGYVLLRKIVFFGYKGKQNILYIIVIITSLILGLIGGGRTGVIDFVCAMLIEFYILWNQKYEWKKNFSWKYIRIGFVMLIIGIPVFYYSLLLIGRSTDKTLFDYISNYIGGSIQNFNLYVQENGTIVQSDSWGEETFTGIYVLLNKLGISAPVKNINLEFRSLNAYIRGNVYTFFRRPLHDFGLAGMCIFSSCVSFIYSWLYYGKIKNRTYYSKVEYVTILYGYFYYEVIYSSIDQCSARILSLNHMLILIVILLGYFWVSNVHIVWGKKRYKYKLRKGYAVYSMKMKNEIE